MKSDLMTTRKAIFLPFLFSIILISCKVHHIYLVRHAEKAGAMQKDPPLTDAGTQRAGDLASLLSGKKIGEIYSTKTIRTMSTAQPLAAKLGREVQPYSPDTVLVLLNRLKNGKQNALVVGHSNTVLPMLEMLGVSHSKKEIPDWEYDNIFRVTFRNKGLIGQKVNFKALKYGQPSAANANQ